MKKKLLAGALAAALALTLTPAVAAENEASDAANALYELGLFSGVGTNGDGTPNFALDVVPTRHEAVTMLVRLLGKDEEAKAGTWETPFTDVADWAAPYVGYAYANGLTTGTGADTFGGTATVNASQYITFVLRALGYESGVDFQWDKAWALSDELGMTDGRYNAETPDFLRGDIAIISNSALHTELKGQTVTLAQALGFEAVPDEPVDPEPDEEIEEKDPVFESGMEFVNSQPEVTRDILIENGMTVLTSADAVKEATGINKSDEFPTVGYTAEPNINGYHTESELDLSGCVLDYEALDYIIKCKKEWKDTITDPAYAEIQGLNPDSILNLPPDYWSEEAFWVLGDAGEEMVMAAAKWPEKADVNGPGVSTTTASSLADAIKKWNADDDWLARKAASPDENYWCFAHYTDKNGRTTYAYFAFYDDVNPGGLLKYAKSDYYINGIHD